MSESWRRKVYYPPRILVSVDAVLNSPIPNAFVCLTGGQINLLRALLEYAERRSTFVSEYHEQYYLAPSEAEWEQLLDVVAEAQEALVSCEDIVTQLACICDAISALETKSGTQGLPAGDDQANYDDYESDVEEDVGDPPAAFPTWDDWRVQKCKSAQKFIDDMVDAMERVQALTTAGTVVTFAIMNTILITSAIAPPLALVIIIVEALAALGADLMGECVSDWLVEHKQQLVCLIYNSATVDETRSELSTYIDEEWDCLAGPQVVEYLFGRRTLSRIYDGTMPDYDDWQGNYSEGYCDACVQPIVGSDWWAQPLMEEEHTIIMNHTAGGYWLGGCDNNLLANSTSCGIVFRIQGKTGTCSLKRMSQGEAGCTYNGWWGNQTEDLGNNTYFAVNGTNIDEVECKAELAPGSTTLPNVWIIGGNAWKSAAYQMGWNCTGYAEIVIEYIVYQGSPP